MNVEGKCDEETHKMAASSCLQHSEDLRTENLTKQILVSICTKKENSIKQKVRKLSVQSLREKVCGLLFQTENGCLESNPCDYTKIP